MALTGKEEQAIFGGGDAPERRRFLRHRDGYRAELDQIERLRKRGGASAEETIRYVEGQILADYLRITHANGDPGRLGRWQVTAIWATLRFFASFSAWSDTGCPSAAWAVVFRAGLLLSLARARAESLEAGLTITPVLKMWDDLDENSRPAAAVEPIGPKVRSW